MKTTHKPITTGTKTCICCGQEKHVTEFHAHKQMKDGRLNKCSQCVVAAVAAWRAKNSDARKVEHQRNVIRKGIKPRSQYLLENSLNAIGRKASSLKYFHKRVAQTRGMPVWNDELDELAFEEAKRLAEQRTALTGAAWSIDHIVPINHKKATGLHNGFNLNVAPASWNSSKGNRHMRRYFGA